jgi:hypothetical protein
MSFITALPSCVLVLKTVFPIGCRKAGRYNQWSKHSQQLLRRE